MLPLPSPPLPFPSLSSSPLPSPPYRDQEVIQAVVKKLGKYELSNVVTEATTHVVSGAPRRTLNTLAASVWGCWVLSVEWVRGRGGEGRKGRVGWQWKRREEERGEGGRRGGR